MWYRRKLERLTAEINNVTTLRTCASFVLALTLVSIVGDGTAMELIGTLDMKLNFDVWFKATGRLVAGRKRNVLCGDDGDCEMEGFAGDGVGDFFVVAVESIA
jgi:hypothetical protein